LDSANDDDIYLSVLEERWAKTKAILAEFAEMLDHVVPKFLHKQLLSHQGFLIYVTRTYPIMVLYLKGLHLTIKHWRDDRDAEGWPNEKLRRRRMDAEILETLEDHIGLTQATRDLFEAVDPATPPTLVEPIPRLRGDMMCLQELFKDDEPSI
jgi:hypothetical protein